MMQSLAKSFKRAIVKKVELLPNVSEYRTEKLGYEEYALRFGLEKTIKRIVIKPLKESSEPNRYLERQIKRLEKHLENGNYEKAEWLGLRLISRSTSFRVLAMNRVCPDWFTWKARPLRRVWSRLTKITRTLSSSLRFRRFWIDKKPGSGDGSRPIGAPHKEWRMYAYMFTDIMERILNGRGELTDWQHGGRSTKGIVTAWKELLPILIEKPNIYEFDLKGFFDNINHDYIYSVVYRGIGPEFARLIEGTLRFKNKPTKIYLPEKAADMKFLAPYTENIKKLLSDFHPDEEVKIDRKYPELKIDIWDDEWRVTKELLNDLRPVEEEKTDREYPQFGKDQIWDDEWRAKARDKWKGLDKPNKGLPQGLSWSPLLSTNCVESVLTGESEGEGFNRSNILMYVDDGLIFADSKEELDKLIIDFKECMEWIGVSISEEKSRMLKQEGEFLVEKIKFLGLEYNTVTNQMWSKTRSGTSKMLLNWTEEGLRQFLIENPEIPYFTKKELDWLGNTFAVEKGAEKGFLGCLISEAMSPRDQTLEEKREEIWDGQLKAWLKIVQTDSISKEKGFIWKFQDLFAVKPTLTNISSIATHLFLESSAVRKAGMRQYSRDQRRYKSNKRVSRVTLGTRAIQ